jgi:ParB/RepB/Spo0J family partition protein
MSKAGLASIAEGRRDVLKIDPRKLSVRSNWNSRDFSDPANLEHIESLANSIAEKGVITPIRANWEDGKAYIVNGECRYRACMLLIERGVDIKTVPVIGDDQFANDVDRLFTQYLENTGKPFTDLERARHFKRLIDLGWQQEDIAKRSGKTQGWVSQTLALLTAPVAVQKMITQGEVSPTLAMQVVRDEGSAAETVLKNGLAKSGTGKVTPASVGRQNIKTCKRYLIASARRKRY